MVAASIFMAWKGKSKNRSTLQFIGLLVRKGRADFLAANG